MKDFLKGVGILFAVCIILGGLWLVGKGCSQVDKQLDNAVVNYEEFQNIYNTCQKLNTDLCNMKDLPEDDKMFEQFSKAQRVNTLKTQLNRWIEEYNAKSNQWNRSIWKSKDLPYELNVNQFNCY